MRGLIANTIDVVKGRMSVNTEKQVNDFMMEYAVKSVRESSHCAVKHDRTDKDFVEYAKWVPFKYVKGTPLKVVDVRAMIIDYFESDREHYFEVARQIEMKKKEMERVESEIA